MPRHAPARPSAAWVGREEADRPAVRLFARALGGRDLALGLGCLLALRNGSGARRWLEAGALADVGDTFATVVTFAALPRRSRYGILAITLGAGLGGLVLAPLIEPAGTPAPSPMS